MRKVACNPMVWRQTPDSRFSHFQGTWAELERLVEVHFGSAVALNPEGTIMKLEVPADGFFSSIVEVTPGTPLRASFGVRQRGVAGELPYVQVVATDGRKVVAKHVDIILYHDSTLKIEEKMYDAPGEVEPVFVEAEWHIISINARATEGEEPPNPVAMARNMAAGQNLPEGVGGTPRTYTAEDFMRAILYWQGRAQLER